MPDAKRKSRRPSSSGSGRSKSESGPSPSASSQSEGAVRLQKVLAAAGFGSRRACEELITDGRVEVDKKRAQLGMQVDPLKQKIHVDGELLVREKPVYYLVHKPDGYVTTNRDPEGRPRVIDLVDDGRRLFPVGRLDMHSEGLILVTNDGDLANRLAHPRYGIHKTYQVQVAGSVAHDDMAAIRKGVFLADGRANVERITIKRRHKTSTVLEMVLAEGRNREIRRIFAGVGHRVQRLKRIAFGPLKLGEIVSGDYRMLTPAEVAKLRKLLTAPTPDKPTGTAVRRKKSTSRTATSRKPGGRKPTAGKTGGRKPTTGKPVVKKPTRKKTQAKGKGKKTTGGKSAVNTGGGRRDRAKTKGRNR